MVKKRKLPRPTEGELQLLGILWERGPATVRELFEEVNAERPVVYTGVLKLLQIMTEKGLVLRDERERAHVYRAAVSQADTERRLLRELSERFFAGSAAQLALRALEMEKSSDEELDAIRKLIERKAAASQ
ncbi:MAG: transcriptional repressor, CopY family [Bryobacterales bacterium]|nr:transcriptional repressor, CopY family [Bryobacterales bacterium]